MGVGEGRAYRTWRRTGGARRRHAVVVAVRVGAGVVEKGYEWGEMGQCRDHGGWAVEGIGFDRGRGKKSSRVGTPEYSPR